MEWKGFLDNNYYPRFGDVLPCANNSVTSIARENKLNNKIFGPELPPPLPVFPKLDREKLKSFIDIYSKPHSLATKLISQKEDQEEYEATFTLERTLNLLEKAGLHSDEVKGDDDEITFSVDVYGPDDQIVGYAEDCTFDENTVKVDWLQSDKTYKKVGTAIIEALFRVSLLSGRGGNIHLISGFSSNLFYFKLGFRCDDPLELRPPLYKERNRKLQSLHFFSFCSKFPKEDRNLYLEKVKEILNQLTPRELKQAKERTYLLKTGINPTKNDLMEITTEDILDYFYENIDDQLKRIVNYNGSRQTSPDITIDMHLAEIAKASFSHLCFQNK